jgi:hypothetical protein
VQIRQRIADLQNHAASAGERQRTGFVQQIPQTLAGDPGINQVRAAVGGLALIDGQRELRALQIRDRFHKMAGGDRVGAVRQELDDNLSSGFFQVFGDPRIAFRS